MKNFDNFQELTSEELVDNNGGWVLPFVVGTLVAGPVGGIVAAVIWEASGN